MCVSYFNFFFCKCVKVTTIATTAPNNRSLFERMPKCSASVDTWLVTYFNIIDNMMNMENTPSPYNKGCNLGDIDILYIRLIIVE